MPRSPSSSALFKRVTVELPAAEFEALSARAKAAGVPVGAFLRDDREARDREQAIAVDRAVGDERRRANREHREALVAIQRSHKAETTAAAEQAQAAVAAAYQQGLAQADPELIAQAEEARQVARSWQSGVQTLLDFFGERGKMILDLTAPSARAARSRALDAQESVIRLALGRHADQLPLPGRVAAQIEAAREDEREDVLEAARLQIAKLVHAHSDELDTIQKALTTETTRVHEREVALDAAASRIRDLEAVVAGVNAEDIAERARRDPSDWLLGLSAALSRVAAQPRIAALAAGQEPVR